jgi:hypothetical protein
MLSTLIMSSPTFQEILQALPPGEYHNVPEVVYTTHKGTFSDKNLLAIRTPSLRMHCDSAQCNGVRLFEYNLFPMHYDVCEIHGGDTSYEHVYIEYLCQNCKENLKSFAIMFISVHDDDSTADIIKFGEYPFYGPTIPPKLISLIGPDRELFLKGLRCESQRLGIAAFSYYRRVIENQRDRIIDKITDALSKTSVDNNAYTLLINLKKQRQFKTSVDELKPYLPESLLIEGNNPLALLHKSLSIGLHELSDEDCLSYAHSIRIVLAELAVKLKFLLSDKNELKGAINTLNKL